MFPVDIQHKMYILGCHGGASNADDKSHLAILPDAFHKENSFSCILDLHHPGKLLLSFSLLLACYCHSILHLSWQKICPWLESQELLIEQFLIWLSSRRLWNTKSQFLLWLANKPLARSETIETFRVKRLECVLFHLNCVLYCSLFSLQKAHYSVYQHLQSH